MNIEKDLKKDGITIVSAIDTLTTTLISKSVAEKLTTSFPFHNLRYDDLFIKISRLPMYFAKMPEGMAEANYLYKNSSIYFKEGLSLQEMQTLAVHEFIHYYQELKDKNNILYRLGLCDFTNFKVYGMGLNEGAVQLMTVHALKEEKDTVMYYEIELTTPSPNYYPILCNLVDQMAYVTGEQVLFDSTLHSNDKFKNAFISYCGEKCFYTVQDNLDRLLKAEEKISTLSSFVQQEDISEKQIVKASLEIGKCKKIIKDVYFQTQNLILTSYFTNSINEVFSEKNIEDYRKKLYNFRDYIGVTDGYTYFNEFYINRMAELDDKYEALAGNVYPVLYKRGIFQILFAKLKNLFGGNTEKSYDRNLS